MDDDIRISKQLDSIHENLKVLPKLEAQVENLALTTKELGSALQVSTAELRSRDIAHAEELSNLKLLVSQINLGLSGVSTTVSDLKLELLHRVSDLEKQVKALFDNMLRHGDRVGKLNDRVTAVETSIKKLEECSSTAEILAKLNEFINQWTPWLKALKWALTIAGGILVTAITGAIIWALIQSGGKW